MQTPLHSPDTSKIRIVLYQMRSDDLEREFEFNAFVRATGLGSEQIKPVDVIADGCDGSELVGASAAIIGGSGYSVFDDVPNQEGLISALQKARDRKLPTLGICYGAQLIAHAFGGEVIRDMERKELGTVDVRTTDDAWTDMLFADAPDVFAVQEAHRDRISVLPHGAVLLAENDVCPIQAFVVPSANMYAVQFHPERTKEDFIHLIDNRLPDYYEGADMSGVKEILRDTEEAKSIVRRFIERMAVQFLS